MQSQLPSAAASAGSQACRRCRPAPVLYRSRRHTLLTAKAHGAQPDDGGDSRDTHRNSRRQMLLASAALLGNAALLGAPAVPAAAAAAGGPDAASSGKRDLMDLVAAAKPHWPVATPVQFPNYARPGPFTPAPLPPLEHTCERRGGQPGERAGAASDLGLALAALPAPASLSALSHWMPAPCPAAGASCFPLCEGNRCVVKLQVFYPKGGSTVGLKVGRHKAGGCSGWSRRQLPAAQLRLPAGLLRAFNLTRLPRCAWPPPRRPPSPWPSSPPASWWARISTAATRSASRPGATRWCVWQGGCEGGGLQLQRGSSSHCSGVVWPAGANCKLAPLPYRAPLLRRCCGTATRRRWSP